MHIILSKKTHADACKQINEKINIEVDHLFQVCRLFFETEMLNMEKEYNRFVIDTIVGYIHEQYHLKLNSKVTFIKLAALLVMLGSNQMSLIQGSGIN